MGVCVWLVFLVVVNAAHSYILRTANIDDVHNMIKQLVLAPAADQIMGIWRRAYNQFKQKDGDAKTRQRTDVIPVPELIMKIAKQIASSPVVNQVMGVWRNQFKDLAAREKPAAGDDDDYRSGSESDGYPERRSGIRNESFYLKSNKKVFDDV